MGSGPNELKRSILFFDRMSLLRATQAIGMWRYGPYSKQRYRDYANELEYLLETPLFDEVLWDQVPSAITQPTSQDERDFNEALQQLDDTTAAIDRISPPDGPPQTSQENPDLTKLPYLIDRQRSLLLRMEALRQRLGGVAAVAAEWSPPPLVTSDDSGRLQPGDVIQLVVHRVSIPDELTPWEDIMALKADRDLTDRVNKLHRWARKTAKSEQSLEEADEALSDLLSDYERHLKVHRLQFGTTALETVVVGGFGILEDVAKMRLKNLASRAFAFRKFQVDLMLSEMKAPGREVSVITALNERFRT